MAKERNWRLLEEKGDLDISLGHVTEVAKGVNNSGVGIRLGEWGGALKEITRYQHTLSIMFA